MDIAKLLEGGNLKTAEDQECAGRILARGYAHEMSRLCGIFGLDKMAEEIEEGAVMAEDVAEEGDVIEDDILELLKELGGI